MFRLLRRIKSKSTSQVDEKKRKFLIDSVKIISVIGTVFAAIPFVSSLSPNKQILRKNKPLKVNIGHLVPGSQMTVIWRGKPVWIFHRTPQQLQEIRAYNANLRDPDSLTNQQPEYAKNVYRSRNPNYLVLIGLCTHLGCSPKLQSTNIANKTPGFYCPCHGSQFDLSGRVYKNMPAPLNLEVPPYYFLSDDVLVIGDAHEA